MHIALYRKYRPQKFSDVYGQEGITDTLSRQVKTGKIAHAYLFTGSRGTGKTTCARIFACAVNCENPQNGDPCGECEICRLNKDGELLDIIEIDGASHNGVDSIRDLQSTVLYTPAQSKYKIYIIDEVHMLSTGAFNALLKTLEDPPSGVIFILATTEPHKVPPTILSRCQRFDFKRIDQNEIITRLRFIAEAEGAPFEEEALSKIASLCDGSLRDGVSLLDKLISSKEGITAGNLNELTGSGNPDELFELLFFLQEKNTKEAFALFEVLYKKSSSAALFCNELIYLLRNLMLIKAGIKASASESFAKAAERFTLEEILYYLTLLTDTQNSLPLSLSPKLSLEMFLVRFQNPALLSDAASLIARIERVEAELAILKSSPKLFRETEYNKENIPLSKDFIGLLEADVYMDTTSASIKDKSTSPPKPVSGCGNEPSSASAEDRQIVNWESLLKNPALSIGHANRSLLVDSKAFIKADALYIETDNMAAKARFSEPSIKASLLSSLSALLGCTLLSLSFENPNDTGSERRDPFLNWFEENKDNIKIK